MIRRTTVLASLLLIMAVGLAGCSKGQKDRRDLQAAILRTQQLSGQFIYLDRSGGTETQVKGIVADDYRYKAEVSVNGQTKIDEVVSDDSVADLFVDPSGVALLARRTPEGRLLTAPADDTSATTSGISVVDALVSQRWVIDPTGAPVVFTSTAKHPIGQDPIFDARDVFGYTEHALLQARAVTKYDSESITPTFKNKDDPFAKPKHGAKLIRYDLAPRPVPRKNTTTSGANQAVPDVDNFRRMVVYVQNGLVVRIMEDTTLDWRLDDIKRNYSLSLSGSTQQQADEALGGINAVRLGQGTDPIRPRQLDFEFINPGQSFDVSLPTSAVIGPLHLLVNRGSTVAGLSTPPPTTVPPGPPDTSQGPAGSPETSQAPAGSPDASQAPTTEVPTTAAGP